MGSVALWGGLLLLHSDRRPSMNGGLAATQEGHCMEQNAKQRNKGVSDAVHEQKEAWRPKLLPGREQIL